MADTEQLVSKGEFARIINVSAGRVSQMIAEGKIGADALEGDGRAAKIRLNLARRQIAERTDIGQRLGNGITTQLEFSPPAAAESAPRAAPAPPSDPVAEGIKRERLRSIQLQNQRLAEDRLAEQGRYIRTDQAQAAMVRLVGSVLSTFEGGLAEMAGEVAAKHGLPQRDVLHTMRAAFREIRSKAAANAKRQLGGLPQTVPDEIVDASDPPAGEA